MSWKTFERLLNLAEDVLKNNSKFWYFLEVKEVLQKELTFPAVRNVCLNSSCNREGKGCNFMSELSAQLPVKQWLKHRTPTLQSDALKDAESHCWSKE